MKTLKDFFKKFLSQKVINVFFHFPVAILANLFFGFPTRRLKVIGVTGTDGKTTTVNMIYQILRASDKKVSMVSTINAYIAGKSYETGFHVTSPDPFMVQRFARQSIDSGDEYLILEVTSHALDQYRFWGVKFHVGVLTNITHEHLDYHKTFENYSNTKFDIIRNVKHAVVNESLKSQIDVRSSKIMLSSFGLEKGDFNQKDVKLKLKIPGDYNIENALAALSVSNALDIPKDIARKVLERFESLPGRMSEIKNSRGVRIFIDFAHTPNGLKNALKSLYPPATKGKVITIFGAEGFRDVEKRSKMGEIAQKLSDFVIVTAVDPRGQMKIINEQISEGIEKAGGKKGKSYFIIEDRKKAIEFAINKIAKKGDIVGIFGKGHEKVMNLDGKAEVPWSDFEVVQKVLR